MHLNELSKNIDKFKKRNIKIISIARDSERLLRKFTEENDFKVDIISDLRMDIIKKYDVDWYGPGGGGEGMKVKQAIPSKYLINKNKQIIWTYFGKDKTDRPSIELLTKIIDEKLN